MAVGDNGLILTSADGTTWQQRTSGTSIIISGVVYANNIFVAVGFGDTILTSLDGISWTSRPPGKGA